MSAIFPSAARFASVSFPSRNASTSLARRAAEDAADVASRSSSTMVRMTRRIVARSDTRSSPTRSSSAETRAIVSRSDSRRSRSRPASVPDSASESSSSGRDAALRRSVSAWRIASSDRPLDSASRVAARSSQRRTFSTPNFTSGLTMRSECESESRFRSRASLSRVSLSSYSSRRIDILRAQDSWRARDDEIVSARSSASRADRDAPEEDAGSFFEVVFDDFDVGVAFDFGVGVVFDFDVGVAFDFDVVVVFDFGVGVVFDFGVGVASASGSTSASASAFAFGSASAFGSAFGSASTSDAASAASRSPVSRRPVDATGSSSALVASARIAPSRVAFAAGVSASASFFESARRPSSTRGHAADSFSSFFDSVSSSGSLADSGVARLADSRTTSGSRLESSNRRVRSRLDRRSSSSSVSKRARSASSAPSREAAWRASPRETEKMRPTNVSASTPRMNGVDAKRRRARSPRDGRSGNARDRLASGASGLDRSSRDSRFARWCLSVDVRNASLVSRSRARSSFRLWVVAVSASTTTERSSVPPYVDDDGGPESSARAFAAPPPMHHARNPRDGDPPPSPCPPVSREDEGSGGSGRGMGPGGRGVAARGWFGNGTLSEGWLASIRRDARARVRGVHRAIDGSKNVPRACARVGEGRRSRTHLRTRRGGPGDVPSCSAPARRCRAPLVTPVVVGEAVSESRGIVSSAKFHRNESFQNR